MKSIINLFLLVVAWNHHRNGTKTDLICVYFWLSGGPKTFHSSFCLPLFFAIILYALLNRARSLMIYKMTFDFFQKCGTFVCRVHSIFFVMVTNKRKNKLPFSIKSAIFFTENKQTRQLIFFVFAHFDQNTKNDYLGN